MIKFTEKFDQKPEGLKMLQHNYSQGSLLIKNCIFESTEESGSSLFLSRVKMMIMIEVVNCKFTGNLANDAHFIDGKMILNENPKIIIKSCNFDSNENKAVNSNLFNFDLKKNLQSNNSFAKNSFQFNMWIILPTLVVSTFAMIILFDLTRRMKNDNNESNKNESIEA